MNTTVITVLIALILCIVVYVTIIVLAYIDGKKSYESIMFDNDMELCSWLCKNALRCSYLNINTDKYFIDGEPAYYVTYIIRSYDEG